MSKPAASCSARDQLAEKIAKQVSKASDNTDEAEANVDQPRKDSSDGQMRKPAASSAKDQLAEKLAKQVSKASDNTDGPEADGEPSVGHVSNLPEASGSSEVANKNNEPTVRSLGEALEHKILKLSNPLGDSEITTEINETLDALSSQESSDGDSSFSQLIHKRLLSKKSNGKSQRSPTETVFCYDSELEFSDSDKDPHRDSGCEESRSQTPQHDVSSVPHSSSSTGQTNTGLEWMERNVIFLRAEVVELRKDVQEANLNIARLLRFLMSHGKKLQIPAGMPSLPLRTFDNFDKFEEFLGLKVNMDAVIGYLALLPNGKNEEKAAMALMAKFMSNGLASAFNFEGQGWKLAFTKAKAWKPVEGALAVQFKGSSLNDAIAKVKSWLRNAPKREGGKPASAFLK